MNLTNILYAGFWVLIIAFAAGTAHGQTRLPAYAHALVTPDNGKGGVVRVVGFSSNLLAGTDATDSPIIRAETRNAAGDSFAAYPPVRIYNRTAAECTNNMLISSNSCVYIPPAAEANRGHAWSIWFAMPNQSITPAEIRFGNGAGDWTAWRAVPLAVSLDGIPAPPDVLPDLRGINLAIARYDEYPRQPETPGSVAPPTDLLKDHLRSLPGGELTSIFLIPMIAVGFCLTVTRSPALLLLVTAGTMVIAIFLVGASPFALILPAVIGISGALLGIQFGYTARFGG